RGRTLRRGSHEILFITVPPARPQEGTYPGAARSRHRAACAEGTLAYTPACIGRPTPSPLEVPRPSRHREVPYLVALRVEHELGILRRREPDIVRHLAVELARAPTRIAEDEQALLRPGLGRDVAQDLRARAQCHVSVDVERAGATILGAVHHQ